MKTILVPTDFSDHALYALKVAASIARKINATINLVHVYNLPSSGYEENQYYEKFYRELKKKADKQLEELMHLNFLKNLVVQKHIVTDMLMWKIVMHENFNNADLIVLGSHGTNGFNKAFIGSNTEKVVRLADSPVLTIKNEIDNFSIENMVFASNFFEESYQVFEKIKFIANIYHAHIYLLKVITPKEFEPTPVSERLLNHFVKEFDLKNYSVNIYNNQHIESGIIEFSNEVDADLIAIETHGRTGLAHLINGSITEDIVKNEPKPVLSIKIPSLSRTASKYLGFYNDYENWGSE